MARTTLLTTDADIRHDGTAETLLARRGEALRRWAAPQIEAARAWAEAGAALGEVGGAVAAEQGRRVAPAVTAGLGAVAPTAARGSSTLAELLDALQGQARQWGEDASKGSKKARRAAAKKGRRAAKKADRRAGDLKDAAVQGGLSAAGLVAAGLAALQEQGERLAPQVQDRLAETRRAAASRRDEFAPVAAARLADVAGGARKGARELTVPTPVEQALIALTGDKAVVKKARTAAARYVGRTEKDLKRAARRADRPGGRGWILAGMAAAASGAGLAVWKLTKPVQDPWTAPVPGPITANIPVVQPVEGSANPYAMQEKAVAEAQGRGGVAAGLDRAVDRGVDVRPTVQNETETAATQFATDGTGHFRSNEETGRR